MNVLWRLTVDRLSTEATHRGGTAILDEDLLTLQPPAESGETVRVLRFHGDASGQNQHVTIGAGFAFRLTVSLDGEKGPEDVCNTVAAIMDGNAVEVAEVAEDGTWLHVTALVETHDGGNRRSTQIAPAWRLKGVPVDHEHQRRIEPWPRAGGDET